MQTLTLRQPGPSPYVRHSTQALKSRTADSRAVISGDISVTPPADVRECESGRINSSAPGNAGLIDSATPDIDALPIPSLNTSISPISVESEVSNASAGSGIASTDMRISWAAGCATLKGVHHPNEDRLLVVEDLGTHLTGASLPHKALLATICDGHDGSACAEFITKEALLPSLCANFGRDIASATSPTAWLRTLHATFESLERKWIAKVAETVRSKGRTSTLSMRDTSAGSCATAVVVCGDMVVAANAGDCRAVLRRADGSLEVLTEDHRCCNEAERRRILDAGGFIKNNRVIGVLEPTRTIGDLLEKTATRAGVIAWEPYLHATKLCAADIGSRPKRLEHPTTELRSASRKVSSAHNVKPHVVGSMLGKRLAAARAASRCTHGQLHESAKIAATSRLSFVLCATDGVWDVLSVASAMHIVCASLEVHGSPAVAAKELVHTAQRHGSTDDISAIVIWLYDDAAEKL